MYFEARYYDPLSGRFISPDPLFGEQMDKCLSSVIECNLYQYTGNNPVMYVDIEGRALEIAWDVANLAIGAASFADNVRSGNWGMATLDGVGLIYDGVATAVPFLPGGASAGLKAYRAGNSVKDSLSVTGDVSKAFKALDDVAKNASTTARATTEGTKIHKEVGSILDGKLSEGARNFFPGANKSSGIQPDMSWKNANGVWADGTTPGAWRAHERKYNASFGEGIPLLYERGRGVVNSTPLRSGAGVAINSAELAAEQISEE